jgi:hypothetical protein
MLWCLALYSVIMPSGIYAEWHLCRVAFMPSGIYSVWHLCRVAFMLSVIMLNGLRP